MQNETMPEMEVGPLFYRNYNSEAPVVVNQGGTSAGKTTAILQTITTLLLENPGHEAEVLGQDRPNLKKGPLKEALRIINSTPRFQVALANYNKSDLLLTFRNGSTMSFNSYDDAQDAKQWRPDYLFCNEANGVPWDIFNQRYIRTKRRTWIDYNPDAPFWVHETILRDKQTYAAELLISDHRHNPFLPEELRRKIEALKDTDIELWKVYARGKTGSLQGLVYPTWSTYDPGDQETDKHGVPRGARFVAYGLDFGYTNDPTALVGIWVHGQELLVKEYIYQTGMNAQDISDAMKDISIDTRDEIWADGSDPRLIADIKRIGRWNIKEAEKGGDSVNNGISNLKQYRIRVLPGSTNVQKELRAYKWLTDKAGNPLNKPVDFMNHAMDAMRYAGHKRLKKPKDRTNASSRFT
jgi:phage terminase large subunit